MKSLFVSFTSREHSPPLNFSENKIFFQGVFRARKVLSEDYGSIHLHIGHPESIRQFSVGKIDRVMHGLEPRYVSSDQE